MEAGVSSDISCFLALLVYGDVNASNCNIQFKDCLPHLLHGFRNKDIQNFVRQYALLS